MRAAFALALLLAPPAAADTELLEFMGGQGCTFGPQSRAAALDAGFAVMELDALIEASLSDGTARREGDYVVLAESLCDIRLPDLDSPASYSTPRIVAMTSAIDAYADQGFPGCFLQDAPTAFDALAGGGPGSGFADYVAFVGSGIAAGGLAYFSSSAFEAPPGFQVVAGPCANVPQIESIRRRQATLRAVFGPMIRRMGEENTCTPEAWPSVTIDQMDSLIRLQGGDPDRPDHVGDGVNAWMWMEIFMLTAAAGWYEGVPAASRGTPRPPLCHYD